MREFFKKYATALALSALVLAFALTQFYIFSDLFIAEIHSDTTDTLVWARASYDSGSMVNPDYGYGYVLMFSLDKLMLLLIPIFGTGLTTMRVGMLVFSALLAFVMTRFFRALKWSKAQSYSTTAAMLMFFTFSKKLREIYFAHVIHYSLAVLLLMGIIVLFTRFAEYEKQDDKRRINICFGFLALLVFLASTDGPAVIMFASLAFTAGLALESLLTERSIVKAWRKRGVRCLILAFAIAAGYAAFKYCMSLVSSVYTDLTLAQSVSSNPIGKYMYLIKKWFVLLGYNGVFSSPVAAFKNTVIVGFGFTSAVLFAISPFTLKKMSVSERVFSLAAYFICFETLVVSVLTQTFDKAWRLSSFVFIMPAVGFIALRHIALSDGKLIKAKRALASVIIAGYTVCAVSLGAAMPLYSRDTKYWYGENTVIDVLQKNGLTYGYSTDFWFGNSITALTENEITISKVKLDSGELYKNLLQTSLTWFDDQPAQEEYFLICTKDEAAENPHLFYDAKAQYESTQYDTRNRVWRELVISVYDHNIMNGKQVVEY